MVQGSAVLALFERLKKAILFSFSESFGCRASTRPKFLGRKFFRDNSRSAEYGGVNERTYEPPRVAREPRTPVHVRASRSGHIRHGAATDRPRDHRRMGGWSACH